MAFTIRLDRPKDLQAVFSKAKRDVDKRGISWSGDTQQGHCSGFGFEGTYVVDEGYITITVLKKPLFITKARIDKEIKRYLGLA